MINKKPMLESNLGQEHWNNKYTQQNMAPTYPVSYITDFAFKNFKPGGRVLDLGCGMGRHVKFLAQFGFDAFGCDYSSQGVLHTKELLNSSGLKADVREADMLELPYDDEYFDGLISYGVLFYAKDEVEIKKALSEVYRVLKKGGSAFFQVRNLEDDRYKQAIKKSKYIAVANQIEGRIGFLENGIQNYYFDEEEVKRLFGIFYKIEINYIKRSYDNESYRISYYLIGIWK